MISTKKLYDEDAYIEQFDAKVLSCEPEKDKWTVVLDRTAFFPEGGGQPSDKGTLSNVDVLDVQINEGIIYHIVASPLKKDETVTGILDFKRRFSFMQNHSGEHIVSGIVHRLFGLDNVGFHLNEQLATLDFNGILTSEQLHRVELLANEALWKNKRIKAFYPDENALASLEYRSKKEIQGDIRIVEIEDIDVCACCAPHVNETAQIGIIKLLDAEKMRGGIRIVMKCGSYALDDYNDKFDNISKISRLLSAKQEKSAEAVKLLDSKLNEEKQKNNMLKKRLAEKIAETTAEEITAIFEDGLDIKELVLIADSLHKKHGGIRAAFSNSESGTGFAFAICGEHKKLEVFFKAFKENLNVRGGGRSGMVQGTVLNQPEQIKSFFKCV